MLLEEKQSPWREEVKRASGLMTKGACLLAMEPGFQRAQREWLRGRVSVGSLGWGWGETENRVVRG